MFCLRPVNYSVTLSIVAARVRTKRAGSSKPRTPRSVATADT